MQSSTFQGDLQTRMKVNLKCGTLEEMVLTRWIWRTLEFLRLQIFLNEPELEVVLFVA